MFDENTIGLFLLTPKVTQHTQSHYFLDQTISLVGKVFASNPEDGSSMPGRVIPKIQKMMLDTFLVITKSHRVQGLDYRDGEELS